MSRFVRHLCYSQFSEVVVRRLNARVVEHLLPIGAINKMNTMSRGMVRITMQLIHDDFYKELTCLTIPNIMSFVLSEVFPRDSNKSAFEHQISGSRVLFTTTCRLVGSSAII